MPEGSGSSDSARRHSTSKHWRTSESGKAESGRRNSASKTGSAARRASEVELLDHYEPRRRSGFDDEKQGEGKHSAPSSPTRKTAKQRRQEIKEQLDKLQAPPTKPSQMRGMPGTKESSQGVGSKIAPVISAGAAAAHTQVQPRMHEHRSSVAHAAADAARHASEMMHNLNKRVDDYTKDVMDNDYLRSGVMNDARLLQEFDSGKRSVLRGLREMLVFIVFLLIFTLTSNRWCFNSDLYWFGRGLTNQLVEIEYDEPKLHTYQDITTLGDLKEYLNGTFADFVFTHNDATPQGYNHFLGPVRVAQLRAQETSCESIVPAFMKNGVNGIGEIEGRRAFYCYDGLSVMSSVVFPSDAEETAPYGQLACSGRGGHTNASADTVEFQYNGVNAHTCEVLTAEKIMPVKEQRQRYFTSWTTPDGRMYAAPAYAVLLEPGVGEVAGRQAIQNLITSGYIDRQTRAVVIDMALYNPMVRHVAWIRLAAEVTEAGAVVPRFDSSVVRLWEHAHPSGDDNAYAALEIIVTMFYFYYFFIECLAVKVGGYQNYLQSWQRMCEASNIFLYLFYFGFTYRVYDVTPSDIDVYGDAFTDFKPICSLKRIASLLAACNVFLVWFKAVAYLNIIPSCAILTSTLSSAVHKLFGFTFVFGIILYGFAQAHTIVFGQSVKQYRTIGQSAYALIQAILGVFDFDSLQQAHPIMGPVFFICFVCVAVLVVFNVVIAIVVDSYEEVMVAYHEKGDKNKKMIYFLIRNALRELVEKLPPRYSSIIINCCFKKDATETSNDLAAAMAVRKAANKFKGKLVAAKARREEEEKEAARKAKKNAAIDELSSENPFLTRKIKRNASRGKNRLTRKLSLKGLRRSSAAKIGPDGRPVAMSVPNKLRKLSHNMKTASVAAFGAMLPFSADKEKRLEPLEASQKQISATAQTQAHNATRALHLEDNQRSATPGKGGRKGSLSETAPAALGRLDLRRVSGTGSRRPSCFAPDSSRTGSRRGSGELTGRERIGSIGSVDIPLLPSLAHSISGDKGSDGGRQRRRSGDRVMSPETLVRTVNGAVSTAVQGLAVQMTTVEDKLAELERSGGAHKQRTSSLEIADEQRTEMLSAVLANAIGPIGNQLAQVQEHLQRLDTGPAQTQTLLVAHTAAPSVASTSSAGLMPAAGDGDGAAAIESDGLVSSPQVVEAITPAGPLGTTSLESVNALAGAVPHASDIVSALQSTLEAGFAQAGRESRSDRERVVALLERQTAVLGDLAFAVEKLERATAGGALGPEHATRHTAVATIDAKPLLKGTLVPPSGGALALSGGAVAAIDGKPIVQGTMIPGVGGGILGLDLGSRLAAMDTSVGTSSTLDTSTHTHVQMHSTTSTTRTTTSSDRVQAWAQAQQEAQQQTRLLQQQRQQLVLARRKLQAEQLQQLEVQVASSSPAHTSPQQGIQEPAGASRSGDGEQAPELRQLKEAHRKARAHQERQRQQHQQPRG